MKNKRYYVKIGGIYCDHCRQTIIKQIKKRTDLQNIRIFGNVAVLDGPEGIEKDIVAAVTEAGYVTKREWIAVSYNRWKLEQLLVLLAVAAGFLGVRYLINWLLGYDILNVIPTIDSSLTLGAVFVVGVLTSIHCVGMCGAVNLVASTSRKRALLYNGGRILCYTVTGAAVGFLGQTLSFDKRVLNVFTVAVSLLMLLMGISMTGLISLPVCRINPGGKIKAKGAFFIGILNGFMPCGPLASMQLYAMATASPVLGGLSMLLFGLGTLPLMLGVGMLGNLFQKKKELVQKIMSILIILLSLSMCGRGLSALSIRWDGTGNTAGTQENGGGADLSGYIVAEAEGDSQTAVTTLTYSSYGDIAVKKGIPVTLTINAEKQYITGCNNEVISSDFDFDMVLQEGENVITFLPEETGTYTYTCWMHMIKNKIYVYE